MIPESFIQDVLARTDIVSLIERYVPLKKGGANYMACCPFHNEKSPSFTVSPSKQFYHCFGCGVHGTAIGFLMEYSGLSFRDAIRDLAQQLGMQLPQEDANPEQHAQSQSLLEVMKRSSQYFREQLRFAPTAIEYLKKRGLTGEVAKQFGIGYAPADWQNLKSVFGSHYDDPQLLEAGMVIQNDTGRRYDRFRDRVMFPILDQRGNVIAFGGRVIGAGEPKYLNSPETPLFEKGHELYGLFQARQAIRESGTVVVVEGYMDVVALAQFGFGQAVATLGTATTATHIQKLFRHAERVVFCFDGDKAGRKAAWRALENALEALADNKQIGFVFLPQEHDPDSFVRAYGRDEFNRQVAQATPLSDVLLRELAQRCDLTTSEGRARLIYEAKPLLHKLPTPLLRLQLVKRLAEASGFAQGEVERLCELKSYTPPAPPKAKRSAPSLTRNLLRIVLHKPELARELPAELLPDTPEKPALQRLCQLTRDGAASSYALLREQCRGLPEEAMIEAAASELLGLPFDEAEAEAEFRATVDKLREGEQMRRFAELRMKAQQVGVAGLSAAEKMAYIEFVSNRGSRL